MYISGLGFRKLLRNVAFLSGFLGLQNDALEFFKDDELLVRIINLSVPLFFTQQEPGLLKPFQLALDVAGIFLDQFGKPPDMRLEVGILSIDHYDLAADS